VPGGYDLVGGFGAILRVHRTSRGLTQEELASLSGLSVRAIADMERGRTSRPYPSSVQCLADALRLSSPEREHLGRAARSTPAAVGQAASRDGPADGQVVPFVMRARPGQAVAAADLHSQVDGLAQLARALVAIAGTGGTITVSSGMAEDAGRPALSLQWVLGPVEASADGRLRIRLTGSPDPALPASMSIAAKEPG
jgi:transcriptional regulator with XRE-family HTH domain